MKTRYFHQLCGLLIVVLFSTANANAQSLSDLVQQQLPNLQNVGSQVIDQIQNQGGQQFQDQINGVISDFGKQLGSGGQWQPPGGGGRWQPPGGGWPPIEICPTPGPGIYPPPPCYHYVYRVYYYCHTNGWRLYGTYYSTFSANNAVQSLQNQGYRAYTRSTRVNGQAPDGRFPGGPAPAGNNQVGGGFQTYGPGNTGN